MTKKFSWSGAIVVLLCLALMLYYYLIFRHAMEIQFHHRHAVVDSSTI